MALRDREGNEEDVLVFRARSAPEALEVRELLAGVGVELEMPDAAVRVLFASGQESLEVRVPLEQADAATGALTSVFGEERIPSKEAAAAREEPAGAPSLDEIEARARELEAEEEREREAREARRAERAARGPGAADPDEEAGWLGTIVLGLISAGLLAWFAWFVVTHWEG